MPYDFGRAFIKTPLKTGDALILILTNSLSQTNFPQYNINKTKPLSYQQAFSRFLFGIPWI